jgi:hypothetical protein
MAFSFLSFFWFVSLSGRRPSGSNTCSHSHSHSQATHAVTRVYIRPRAAGTYPMHRCMCIRRQMHTRARDGRPIINVCDAPAAQRQRLLAIQ